MTEPDLLTDNHPEQVVCTDGPDCQGGQFIAYQITV